MPRLVVPVTLLINHAKDTVFAPDMYDRNIRRHVSYMSPEGMTNVV